MLLMIDNYDSFTFNLVQYFREFKVDVRVIRNDELDLPAITGLQPDHIVISPGPCTPDQAGISLEVIKRFASEVPILGVCLGHQAIGQAFGGTVVRAAEVMHGKVSPIYHCGTGIFRGLPGIFKATRYHSLVLDKDALPDCLEVTAWTEGGSEHSPAIGEIMGIRHRELAVEGVQFHPEAILSEQGHQLLKNFLNTGRAT